MEKFQTVRGMRDFLPLQAAKKQWIEDTCRQVFERYGFEPLETPVVEDFNLLSKKGSGGEAIREEIYYFEDKSGRDLGLRFDLTVPLARIVATNKALPLPFKRYQIGKVYRYDRPGEKRWREFTQADWDIIGSQDIVADFDTVAVTIEVMKKLGFKKEEFKVRVNDRQLLEAVALCCEVKKEEIVECFRCIDKLDKMGKEGVEKELKQKGIDTQILSQFDVKKLKELKLENGIPLKKLEELFGLLKKNDLEKFVKFDLSLARGLEYYTGIVFEVCVKGCPSVGGGGRYDKLVELYGGQPTPAVGGSFGVERLLEILWPRIKLERKIKVFVAPIYKIEKGQNMPCTRIPTNLKDIKFYMTEVVTKIRALGINCEMDLMMRNITRTLQNLNRKRIPIVVIVGEDELNKREVTIKYLEEKKQKRIKFSNLEKELRPLLK